MSKRLEMLEASLVKKENLFDVKLTQHIDTVKQANGQPLNDKRNGAATLNKWDRQNNALRNIQDGIEKTKSAIEYEAGKIKQVENAKSNFPAEILTLVESGELIIWRKRPNTLFVDGVDKARIVWDDKKKLVCHKFVREITDKEQRSKFVKIYNSLNAALNKR